MRVCAAPRDAPRRAAAALRTRSCLHAAGACFSGRGGSPAPLGVR